MALQLAVKRMNDAGVHTWTSAVQSSCAGSTTGRQSITSRKTSAKIARKGSESGKTLACIDLQAQTYSPRWPCTPATIPRADVHPESRCTATNEKFQAAAPHSSPATLAEGKLIAQQAVSINEGPFSNHDLYTIQRYAHADSALSQFAKSAMTGSPVNHAQRPAGCIADESGARTACAHRAHAGATKFSGGGGQ